MIEKNARNIGLDAVRAAAICLVLLAHGTDLITEWLKLHGVRYYAIEQAAAFYGVEMFFCLSGFLIGRGLLDLEEVSRELKQRAIKIFLVRRWMRTLPLYYAVLAAYFFVPALDTETQPSVWSYAVFAQNLVTPMPASNWFGPSWSLVIEEWSYLILPLTAFALFRNARRPVLSAACLIIGLATALRIITTDAATEWDSGIRKVMMTRMDAIAYGVIAASMMRFYAAKTKAFLVKIAPLNAALVIIGLWFFTHPLTLSTFYGRVLLFPATGIGFAGLLPLTETFKLAGWRVAATRFIARISYAAYLTHWAFLFLVKKLPKFQFGAYIAGTLVVSTILSYAIEYPIMRRRPRMPPRACDGLLAPNDRPNAGRPLPLPGG